MTDSGYEENKEQRRTHGFDRVFRFSTLVRLSRRKGGHAGPHQGVDLSAQGLRRQPLLGILWLRPSVLHLTGGHRRLFIELVRIPSALSVMSLSAIKSNRSLSARNPTMLILRTPHLPDLPLDHLLRHHPLRRVNIRARRMNRIDRDVEDVPAAQAA